MLSRKRIAAARIATATMAAVLLAGLFTLPAAAHVTADPDTVDSPSFTIAFRVGHGCAGSPTTAVRVQIPEGVEDAEPEEVPGWEVEVVREGVGTSGAVSEVAWTRESPDAEVAGLRLGGRFTEAADDVVYFPLIQECVEGEHRWIDIPATLAEWGDLEEPAPFVRLAFRDGVAEPPPDGAADADHNATQDPTGAATPGPAEDTAADPTEAAADGPTEAATADPADEEPQEAAQETAAEEAPAAGGLGWPVVALVAAVVVVAGGLALARTRRA